MQFVRLDDVTLHYRLIGRPADKPVIVFINSLGTDFRIWSDLAARLADSFALLVYDKRGHGLSELGSAPAAMQTHAEDLIGLLDHLSLRSVVVCGLSIGGPIALTACSKRPELVRALVLCDTAHKIGTAETWNARIAAARESGIASFADGVMEKWFTPAFHRERGADLAGYRTMLVRQDVTGYTAACEAIRDADCTETARAIAVPTLVVVGDQDGSTPPDLVRSLADLVAGARFEVIPGAGHIPCVEQPEVLAKLIREFVSLPGIANG